jgi:magnesium chelatase family protein
LLDRLDMHVEVPRLAAREFTAPANEHAETTAAAAARVARARGVQLERQGTCNARLTDAGVQRWCRADAVAERLLANAMERFGLSGRARQRALKVARTIADLAGAPAVTAAHIGEALRLRCLDDRGASAPSAPCSRPPG